MLLVQVKPTIKAVPFYGKMINFHHRQAMELLIKHHILDLGKVAQTLRVRVKQAKPNYNNKIILMNKHQRHRHPLRSLILIIRNKYHRIIKAIWQLTQLIDNKNPSSVACLRDNKPSAHRQQKKSLLLKVRDEL